MKVIIMSDNSFKSWRKEIRKTSWGLSKKNGFWKSLLSLFVGGGLGYSLVEGCLEIISFKENKKLWSVILSLFIAFIALVIVYLYHYLDCKRNEIQKLLEKKESLIQENNSLKEQNSDLANKINELNSELSNSLDVNRDNQIMEIIKNTENSVFPLNEGDDEAKFKKKLQQICDGVRNVIIKMEGETANDCCVSIKQLTTSKEKPKKAILVQTVRDSSTSSKNSRDDSQTYNRATHYLDENTPYKKICQNYKYYVDNKEKRWNETDFHYLNNSISSDQSFEITRKNIAQGNAKGNLPYESLYVCPSLPLVNDDRKAKISGFICIDSPKPMFFSEDRIQYLNNKMERFADMAYSVIKVMPRKTNKDN